MGWLIGRILNRMLTKTVVLIKQGLYKPSATMKLAIYCETLIAEASWFILEFSNQI